MRMFRRLKVPERGHRLMRFIFNEMNMQRIGYADLADRSGVTRKAIAAWVHPTRAYSARLCNIEAVLNTLGYRIAIVPIDASNFDEAAMALDAVDFVQCNASTPKLDVERVRDIRKLHASGMSFRKIGAKYGVSGAMVNQIVQRKVWNIPD